MNGPTVTREHSGHWGLGFVDFQNPTGDTLTFHISSCNAGLHHVAIIYSLASAEPPRPLSLTVNGQPSFPALNSIDFPATGSWTEWGKVMVQVTLLSGDNSLMLTALQNSGANIDSM
eukprot:SAG11_NODE_7003_length_1210_cov_1.990099_2_plen_117_part_01